MIGSADALAGARRAGRGAERHALQAQDEGAESDAAARTPSSSASHGARSKVELTMRNSLMNTPIGGRPTMAKTPNDEAPAEQRMGDGEAADVGDLLRALDLRDLADGVEDRRFRQAVHRHVQERGEIGERTADPEGEDDDAHVLDRGIGEHAFHVSAAVEHEGGEHHRDEAERRHQRSRRDARAHWRRAAA